MTIIAVDLAAKYSAFVQLGPTGLVLDQYDSAGRSEDDFITMISVTYDYEPTVQLVIEDLPHGVEYRGLVKRVCQIQGRIYERFHGMGRAHEVLFVDPATWRRKYPELRKRGTGMEAVVPVAFDAGYSPPELVQLAGPRGGKALVSKVQTDYCAAYLIGLWALETFADYGTYDVPGTSRYGRPTIKKDR